MERIIITEQDIVNAKSGIPLALKWALARYIAEFCTDKKQMTIKENGVDTIALPDLAQRNTLRESQYKIGVFVREYLGKDYDPVHGSDDNPIPYLMASDEADAWSGFESQIDRLKRSKTPGIADKCYDILNDYHAFCRMVSIEIEQELQVRNDPVGRFAWLAQNLLATFSTDELKKFIEELNAVQEQIDTKEE